MQNNFLVELLVPVSLMIVMFGLGLSLSPKDFTRLTKYPKAVALGSIGHFILLPLIGIGCIYAFSLKPEFAVGIILLVSCGGGVVSNALTLIAKGDTALSITLTSISLPASIISIPLLTNCAILYYMGTTQNFSLPVIDTFVRLVVSLWLPIALGMVVKHFYPKYAEAMDRPARIFSMIFILVLMISIIIVERDRIVWALIELGPATFTLNAAAILIGLIGSRLIRLDYRQSVTIGVELGIQNSATALFVSLSILSSPTIAIPAAVYSLIAFINVAILILILNSGIFRSAQTAGEVR
ncbi:MAG: bile acid:sodium symporter family protein [Methyloligellaceae bacterium]